GRADAWRTASLTVPIDGVPGYRALHYTFGLEAAFLDRFDRLEAEVIEPFATLEAYRDELADDFTLRFVLPLAAALAITTLISVVVGRRITRRLRRLRLALDALGAGDLHARTPEDGRDEVSDLARGFNSMAERLRDSQARIEYLTRVSAWQGIARRLAHEIKNPLTPILLAVQQVHGSYRGDDARYRRGLDTAREVVEQEVQTLKRLVENFSRFAKLPAADRQPGDVAALAREMVEAHPEIPGLRAEAPAEPMMAPIDKGLLRQALTNLIQNAADELRDRDDAEVIIRVHREADAVHLAVDDNGPGVPAAERERVFEPYVTGKPDGTGLGLAIVKKIVLDHGGTIHVASAQSGGARFAIRLPADDEGAATSGALGHP
ncbi:MAG: HAMP domain-containing protein, partial [Myxococcales bacterium]|nr:HAMP domain-containing protein [Myxococcales bacterium]